MGFLDRVKTVATKTKLQSEIALLDRQIVAQQRLLGMELFGVLIESEASTNSDDFLENNSGIRAIYLAVKEDVLELVQAKLQREEQLDQMEEEDVSQQQNKVSIKQWVSNSATAAKLNTEIAYYDREIRLRKEIFGQQVFEELDLVAEASRMSSEEESKSTDQNVLAVLNRVKAAVREILQQKADKEQEIASLSG